jgi:hypothetical protein
MFLGDKLPIQSISVAASPSRVFTPTYAEWALRLCLQTLTPVYNNNHCSPFSFLVVQLRPFSNCAIPRSAVSPKFLVDTPALPS